MPTASPPLPSPWAAELSKKQKVDPSCFCYGHYYWLHAMHTVWSQNKTGLFSLGFFRPGSLHNSCRFSTANSTRGK